MPDPSNVQAYNRYMYALGNPLQYADPTGHWCVSYINVGNTCAPDAPGVRWDAVQTTLGVAGMADPTPIADGANAVISVARGNYTDAGLSALAIVPYVGDLAKGGKYADEAYAAGKSAWRWGKEALGLSDEAVASFRSFTQNNFRENLSRLTGIHPDKALEAHHVLPQAFESDFTKAGLNIHAPQFGSWVEASAHRGWSYNYNQKWTQFFRDNPNVTAQQILEEAQNLAKEFGFNVNFTQ